MSEDQPSIEKRAHELATFLRNEGYTIGFDTSALNEDFDQQLARGRAVLNQDGVSAFYAVALLDGQTDFVSSTTLSDSKANAVLQIEMLGAHFRMVHDALPITVDNLIAATVDEALTTDTDEVDDAE